jgi:hypothetical protein
MLSAIMQTVFVVCLPFVCIGIVELTIHIVNKIQGDVESSIIKINKKQYFKCHGFQRVNIKHDTIEEGIISAISQ